MKRFWLELKDKVIKIDNTNKKIITISNIGLETEYLIQEGTYTPQELARKVALVLEAKYGEENNDTKKDFLVLFLEENIVFVRGSFLDYITNGIEQIDNANETINGAEAYLKLYIPDGTKDVNVSRIPPNWTIALQSDGTYKYRYVNDKEVIDGTLEELSDMANVYKVYDRLKDSNFYKYHTHFFDGDLAMVNAKFVVKTNAGKILDLQDKLDINTKSILDVTTDGRYLYFFNKDRDSGLYDLLVRDSVSGEVSVFAENKDISGVTQPVIICKHGVNKDKRIAIVSNVDVTPSINKHLLEVFDLTNGNRLEQKNVYSYDVQGGSAEYALSPDFNKLFYFDNSLTYLYVKTVGAYSDDRTINFNTIYASIGGTNRRAYILGLSPDGSKAIYYIPKTNGNHRVVHMNMLSEVADYYYESTDYNLNRYDMRKYIDDSSFIVAGKISLRSNSRQHYAFIHYTVNWETRTILERCLYVTEGTAYTNEPTWTNGFDVSPDNTKIYGSVLSINSGSTSYNTGGIFEYDFPFKGAFSGIARVNFPYQEYRVIPTKAINMPYGLAVDRNNIITYSTQDKINKKIL
ncbi:hypothetical protein ABNX05_18215 [Lysinibacillus sp. M3]|uniref:Uncharacterized protein n=1 Tax=Lysinibacillus zambalensis TaxID=3160866 RepID=A0ABV1MVL9_9BACI